MSAESECALLPDGSRPPRLRGLALSVLLDAGLRDAPEARFPHWTPPTLDELAPLLPHYEIIRAIGRGGMGAVYEARHRELERHVALKILPIEVSEEPGFASRFRQEARTMGGLKHPGIVTVHDFGQTAAGHLYYAMEFIDGEDLAQQLAREGLSIDVTVRLLSHVCDALAEAHGHGIVHRDLKPSNILLPKDGGPPKLADFGLAYSPRSGSRALKLTRVGSAMGTLEYAAPEQLSGATDIGPAADLYSLGVVAYELLAGELPRGVFDPPSDRNAAVDPAFDGVVLRAMQSDPSRRFASATEFRAALHHAADRLAQQRAKEQQLRRGLVRRARIAISLALVALAMAATAGFGWNQRTQAIMQADHARRHRIEAEKLVAFMAEDLQNRLESIGRLDVLEEAIAKAEAYYAALPDENSDADTLSRKAFFYRNRAHLHRVKGAWDDALADRRRAIGLRERALVKAPGRADLVFERSRDWLLLAELFSIRGDHEQAITALSTAQHALETHPGLPPHEPKLERQWLIAARQRGAAAMNAGRLEESLATQNHLREVTEPLAAQPGPHQPAWRFELASIEQELGSLAERRKEWQAALAHFSRARELFTQAAQATPWDFHGQYAICGAGARMAVVLIELGRLDESQGALAEPLRIIEDMDRRGPGATHVLHQQRHVYQLMARALYDQKKSDEAKVWQQRSDTAVRALEQKR